MSEHRPPTPRPRRRGELVAATLAVVVVVAGLLVGLRAASSFDRTTGGEVAVVRNGGPLDDNNIRQLLPPSTGRTYVGMFSQVHKYPSTQRFYTITSDQGRGSRSGVDVVHTPTSDGVDVGIEGTLYFTLNTTDAPQCAAPRDVRCLSPIRAFDNQFGIRTFESTDGHSYHPFDGDKGIAAFEDVITRPIIDNALREQIGNFPCAELVSSCALVQNQGSAQVAANVGQKNNVNIAQIQQDINTSLQKDLTDTLGGPYVTDLRFNLVRITLPDDVQKAVNDAQAAFAKVSEAQAQIAQASAQASADGQKQLGYEKCPTCAQIDALHALPQGITVYAPGGTSALALPAGTK